MPGPLRRPLRACPDPKAYRLDASLPTLKARHSARITPVSISKKDVEHVARLARLSLTEEEKERYTAQLGQILECVSLQNGNEGCALPTLKLVGADLKDP